MKKYILFLTMGFTLFISCQRELDFDPADTPPPPPPPPAVNDSTVLSKLIYLDTTLPAPNDTTYVYDFKYNSNKKVTEITGYFYQSGVRDIDQRQIYSYNGSDTLPFKYVDIYYGLPATSVDTFIHYFGYNAQRKIIYDSIILVSTPPFSVNVRNYVFIAPDTTRAYVRSFPINDPSNVQYFTSDYVSVYSGNHIIREKRPDNGTPFGVAFEMTYDNKINPISTAINLNHPYAIVGHPPGQNEGQPNNYLTYHHVETNPIGQVLYEWRLSFAYQYNLLGYPKSAVITDHLGTYDEGNKLIYKYTN